MFWNDCSFAYIQAYKSLLITELVCKTVLVRTLDTGYRKVLLFFVVATFSSPAGIKTGKSSVETCTSVMRLSASAVIWQTPSWTNTQYRRMTWCVNECPVCYNMRFTLPFIPDVQMYSMTIKLRVFQKKTSLDICLCSIKLLPYPSRIKSILLTRLLFTESRPWNVTHRHCHRWRGCCVLGSNNACCAGFDC